MHMPPWILHEDTEMMRLKVTWTAPFFRRMSFPFSQKGSTLIAFRLVEMQPIWETLKYTTINNNSWWHMKFMLTVTSRVNFSLSSRGLPLCPGYSQARFSPSKLWVRRKLMADLMKAARPSGLATMAMNLARWIKHILWPSFWQYQVVEEGFCSVLTVCQGYWGCVWETLRPGVIFELTGLFHWLCHQQTVEFSVQDC